jgi:soluble lytic murein transglycosylase-like protein
MIRISCVLIGCIAVVAVVEGRAQSSAIAPPAPSISDRQMGSATKMQAAAAHQKAAAQKQTTPVPEGSFFSAGWSGPSILPTQLPGDLPECPAMQESEYEPLVREAAARNQLNPTLITAMIRQESAFRPCAISDKGAMGLMQLMPETAGSLNTLNPFDPAQNVEGGARYLKQMLARFNGDLRLALAAYNAGPEKVDKADGTKPAVPDIQETRDYVDSISTALHGESAETKAPPAR